MPSTKIRCQICGFQALRVSRGGRDHLTVDSIKQGKVCRFFKEEGKTNPWKTAPLDCPHLQEAFQQPS